MITVRETVSLNSSPSEIWSVIGAFDSLDSWHPGVASSETVQDGTDKIRHLTLGDGSKIVERLDSHDDDARRYVYTILDAGPLPIRNYQSTLEVSGNDSGSTVTWSSEFEAQGASETDAQAAISGVYTAGLAALIETFGAS